MKFFYTSITFILCSLHLYSQFTISTDLSEDTLFVGQPSNYIVQLSVPRTLDTNLIKWEIPIDSISPGLEILSTSKTSRIESDFLILECSIRFSAEEIGFFPIEPITVYIADESLTSKALLATVYSTIQNPQIEEMRASKESIDIQYNFLDWLVDNWYWILLTLAALAAIAVSWIYYNRRNKEKMEVIIEPEIIVIPPYKVASKKLLLLDESKLWQKGQLKEYHSEISYILREYLEGELGISALENTTREIIQSLQKYAYSNELLEKIRVSLSLTDLVKFAKQKPLEAENRKVLAEAKQVIDTIFESRNSIINS